mgnify:CR=1 FL=1
MERSVKNNNNKAAGSHAPVGKCTKRKKQYSPATWEDEEPSEEQLLQEFKEALKELKLIQEGKLKARPAEELLNEL